MTSAQRRENIAALLAQSEQPLRASALAQRYRVSRQVIVGDIALLRASGTDIMATPKGYILSPGRNSEDGILRTIACNHDPEHLLEELYLVVDNGGGLLDVIVEHPLYGQLTGQLNIFSRYDADEFTKDVGERKAPLLSQLTGGIHLHTLRCKDEASFRRISEALAEAGILLDQN
jgi:transcriptional regulator of NAD metabolism